MTFHDIFKSSFLAGYAGIELGSVQIVTALFLTLLISCYIFFCYRLMTRNTFYSRSFNVSLVALALITAGIILAIQSSVVLSLGMVGALSIVRFRTAVKDPLDLVFLFWSISVGIICGAGLAEVAILMSLMTTGALFIFNGLPVARAPMILSVNYDCGKKIDDQVMETLRRFCKHFQVKSRNVSPEQTSLVVELRVPEDTELVWELSRISGVSHTALLSHDGDVTF